MWQQTHGYSVSQLQAVCQPIDTGSRSVGGSGRRKLGKLRRRKPLRSIKRASSLCHCATGLQVR